MKFFMSLVFVWLLSAPMMGLADDDGNQEQAPEVKAQVFDLSPEQVDVAIDGIGQLFPEGADTFLVGEVGDGGRVSEAKLDHLPSPGEIKAELLDPTLGTPLPNAIEKKITFPPLLHQLGQIPPIKQWNQIPWRIRLVIARVVVNGSIAGLMIVAKNRVAHQPIDMVRVLSTFAVHGAVNGGFQYLGSKVAEFSYADLPDKLKGTFFKERGFDMSFREFVVRTQTMSFFTRVLLTIGSTFIYRALDAAFTGNMETSLYVAGLIAMNIEASLAPAALGLEMGGKLGPRSAKDLPARNTHTFDLQNFTVGVLFAAGLAASSKEFSEAFGIHGYWAPVYTLVAGGGTAWWLRNSRWVNPDLVPLPRLALKGMTTAGRWATDRIKSMANSCREKILFGVDFGRAVIRDFTKERQQPGDEEP